MELEWLKRFAIEYCCLFSSSSVPSFHLPTQPVHLLLCAYKREVAPLQRNTHCAARRGSSSVPSFHLPTQPVHLLLCAYKREVAPLQRNTHGAARRGLRECLEPRLLLFLSRMHG